MDDALKRSDRGANSMGWVLLIALVIAVSVAISLAVQLSDAGGTPPRAVPPCGGLYDECCEDWDDNWGPCERECDAEAHFDDRDTRNRDDQDQDDQDQDEHRDGLFDAEENFADRRLPSRC